MEALNGDNGLLATDDLDDTGNLSQLSEDDDEDDDELGGTGSCGSGDELDSNQINKLPEREEDMESMNQSLSSPGLSSLQSPSTTTSVASPLNMNMLTSPTTPVVPISNMHGSGSSSGGSTCSVSNTPNTSTTASPAASSTTGNGMANAVGMGAVGGANFAPLSAKTLGTRFSHLGMGLTPEQIFQVGTIASSSIVTTVTPAPTVPHITPRNPIGANPRDINNPLNINQLTKRREEYNAALYDAYTHPFQHAHPLQPSHPLQLSHPHSQSNAYSSPHHSIFSTNFSQHFQQHINNHLATTTRPPIVSSSVPSMTSPTLSSIKRHNTAEQPNGAAGSATTASASSETGAISVS